MFLEAGWWQGVAAIVAIVGVVVAVMQLKRERGRKTKQPRLSAAEPSALASDARAARLPVLERKLVLLPDEHDIVTLNVDNALLDAWYETARRSATARYGDARLKRLSVVVYPFLGFSHVSVVFDFYSHWARRQCTFILNELHAQPRHSPPDKPVEATDAPQTFAKTPWKVSPRWPEFLRRAYQRVGPLPEVPETGYQLWADATFDPHWGVRFDDGVTGHKHRLRWDGRRLDEAGITMR